MAYPFPGIIEYPDIFVLLCMNEDLFLARFIFKSEFIKALALMGFGFNGHFGFFGWQFVWRDVVGVVGAAGDDGLVGIALQKADHHFLTDPGDGHGSPGDAGPALADSDPAAGSLIVLAFQIPGELDFDPAMFVTVDFLAFRPCDSGYLRAVHPGLGFWLGPPGLASGNQG